MKYIAILISVLALASCQNFMSLDYEPVQAPAGVVDLETAFNWVASNVSYVPDNGEKWQGPHDTMKRRAGDCEDFAILLAAFCDQMGYSSGIVVGNGHAVAKIDGVLYDAVPIETTDGWKVSGFEPDLSSYDIEYDQPIEAVLRRCFEKYGSK